VLDEPTDADRAKRLRGDRRTVRPPLDLEAIEHDPAAPVRVEVERDVVVEPGLVRITGARRHWKRSDPRSSLHLNLALPGKSHDPKRHPLPSHSGIDFDLQDCIAPAVSIPSEYKRTRRYAMEKLADAQPGALDIPNSGQYLGGLGRTTVYALIRDGEIRASKIRGRTVILRAELDAYLERLRAS
jgi:excisionase family DNA binding protein